MGNDVVCKIVGISNIRMRMFDGQVRALMNLSRSGSKEQSSLVESFGSSRAQVLICRWSIKITKGSMTILK